jgi:hypothetical protein
MKRFKQNLKFLLLGNQHEIAKKLNSYFAEYETIKQEGSIIVMTGEEAKPLICVHLDTINDKCAKSLGKDDIEEQGDILILSPSSKAYCLGGDDRCGLLIALGLLKSNKYHFGFFLDEEIGGVGSSMCDLSSAINRITCFIGLDRKNSERGVPEFASYGYDNKELAKKLVPDWKNQRCGSFTDCSALARNYDLACYNLSIGYRYEHTRDEYIYIPDTFYTYTKLLNLEWDNTVYKPEIKKGKKYDYWFLRDEAEYDRLELDEEEYEIYQQEYYNCDGNLSLFHKNFRKKQVG